MQLPKMPSFSLKGRTALIVGASSGIGTACAVALAEHGAKVTLAARRKDKLEILAHQMEKKEFEVKILELDINDIVKFNDSVIKAEKHKYLVLNKPKNFITTMKDPQKRNTVLDLISGAVHWIKTIISKSTFLAKCNNAVSLVALSPDNFKGLFKVFAP